jgi:hypothetical protein
MANIQISQINFTGYDLLQDEESFLNELATQDMPTVIGGGYGKHWGNNSYGYSGGYSGHSGGYSGHSGGYSGHYNHSCWF